MADVLKEGFLVKKGHVRHNWRTRWFVLLKHELLYFRTKEDRLPAGVIQLNGANLICPPVEISKKPWLLNLTTVDNKQYMIQAYDQPTREEWKAAIEGCIQKLDPAKANRDMSPTRTLTRMESFATTNGAYRDIVQAMQDRHAGVKLREFRLKGHNQNSQNSKFFFTGTEAIDWLISWSFAENRDRACSLASEMLQHGFFNPVHLDTKENVYEKVRDSLLIKEMVDSQDAFYDFVVFAPAESMDLFSVVDEEDESEGSDSDSEDDVLASKLAGGQRASSASITEGSKVLKQGFLLKKRKRRQVWKARKFVLKEKATDLLYYKGSKGHRVLGGIPLMDITVIEKDADSPPPLKHHPSCLLSPTNTLPPHKPNHPQRKSRLILLTATGLRYELEAMDSNERDSWASYIRVASKLC